VLAVNVLIQLRNAKKVIIFVVLRKSSEALCERGAKEEVFSEVG